MPITPRFRLSQTSSHLCITIHIPHIRVSASTIEVLVDGTDVHFYSSPYLLHLTFPAPLLDDAETCREAKATYDPSNQNGMLTLVMYKEEESIWEDLDFLGKLMMQRKDVGDLRSEITERSEERESSNITHHPKLSRNMNKVEVLSSTELNESDDCSSENESEKTTTFVDADDLGSCLKPRYGFLNMHHSIFTDYAREGLSVDMLEMPNPDELNSEERRDLRLSVEQEKFCHDRYLGDLHLSLDDDEADMIYVDAKTMKSHWSMPRASQQLNHHDRSIDEIISGMEQLQTKKAETEVTNENSFFTEAESMQLTSIKAQIPTPSQISNEKSHSLLLSLTDILYAYAYDHRTTSGDPTCESSWTIVTLSPTLSWFESYMPPYDGIRQVLNWSIRRALIYPYLRNYAFVSNDLVKDVFDIIRGGRHVILRCLLQIHQILEKSDFHYLFNKLYINPYICWVQTIEKRVLVEYSHQVEECFLSISDRDKKLLELNLEKIENDAFCDGVSAEGDSTDGIEYSGTYDISCHSNSESQNPPKETNRNVDLLDKEIGHVQSLEKDERVRGTRGVRNLITELS